MPLPSTIVALSVFEAALPVRMISSSTTVALLPFSVGNSGTLDTIDRCFTFELLSVALSGFHTLGYLNGLLQREIWFGEQTPLCRLTLQSAYLPVPKGLVQLFSN